MGIRAAELPLGTRETSIRRVVNGRLCAPEPDLIAREEPLEIQLGFGSHDRQTRTLSITMRTPGHDRELAAGFLYAEGVVSHAAQIVALLESRNTVRVELRTDVTVAWERLQRHVGTTSSCGVCGSTCIETIEERLHTIAGEGPTVPACIISSLPDTVRIAQEVFDRTGGLHAAALFDSRGKLEAAFEDVGRHNAVDKLVGSHLLEGRLPLANSLLLVSGRASFELVQKALVAGIPLLAAVGAPSSLAVELAGESGMTLVGFTRRDRFNIYSGAHRIVEAE